MIMSISDFLAPLFNEERKKKTSFCIMCYCCLISLSRIGFNVREFILVLACFYVHFRDKCTIAVLTLQ